MDCISLCYEARGGPHQTDQYSNYHYLHLICWKQRAQLADIQLSRTHSTEPNFNRGKFSTFHLCMHSMWERMNLLLNKRNEMQSNRLAAPHELREKIQLFIGWYRCHFSLPHCTHFGEVDSHFTILVRFRAVFCWCVHSIHMRNVVGFCLRACCCCWWCGFE